MVKPDWEATRRELIETYKTLNHRVRGKSEDELAAEHNGGSIRAEIAAMRQNEVQFAKMLTNAMMGETTDTSGDEMPDVPGADGDESTNVLISQFGNARATTLNTLAALDDDAWDRALPGNRRVLDLASELAESDREHMGKITRMLGA